MPRYKFIERDFPHIVDIVVPWCGLRGKLDAMNDFHARHGIKVHLKRGRYKDGCRYVRWCFADPAIAKAFAAKFAKLKDNVTLQRSH
jgi:hypothetical protein